MSRSNDSLQPFRVIAARDCSVSLLSESEANLFVDNNHDQGSLRNSKTSSLGLYTQNELVGVVQFGKPRTALMSRLYSLELLRLAFKKGVRVRGGASKLIKGYVKQYKPADFFTYQDTAGEATAVYEYAGMTFVSQAKKKQYLVAPGKTLETSSRKEALGMPYATRFGPDRILGTKLGEVYREDGTRKSNKDIFIEELGWHMEETSGDRVYEWVNNDLTFYTYKITATDSDKYYYGYSHIKKANASVEDCLADGYWGSGDPKAVANKFVNWRLRHQDKLVKTIEKTFQRKPEALEHEWELIGDRWRSDPLCLNSAAGGHGHAHNNIRTLKKECSIHGLTSHQGNSCRKCVAERTKNISSCDFHGETVFWGDKCSRCSALENISLKVCPIHGETKHKGMVCYRCEQGSLIYEAVCGVHGFTVHQGSSCVQCSVERKNSLKVCSVHGLTAHQGDSCYKCSTKTKGHLRECPVHGITKHNGETCPKCVLKDKYTKRKCPVHGLSTFRGSSCASCSSEKTAHKRFHKVPKIGCVYCF